MKDRNEQLRTALGGMPTKERIVESRSIPKEDTVNRQGYAAYSLTDELRLLSMLNTLKIEPQFYRSETETMRELRELVERIGMKDPYFLCQAIVWSRCIGDGMRSINHLAATLAAPFIAGKPYAKAFYGLFDKKNKMGGCIYRADDMSEMKDIWSSLNSYMEHGHRKMMSLPNAMKKGFASAIEKMDTYQLAKYRSSVIDIINLVHANPNLSHATITLTDKEKSDYRAALEARAKKTNGKMYAEIPSTVKTIDAIMLGLTVSADTHEVAQSEAGQEVAKAVKAGKLTKEEAKTVLADAKNDNWEALLMEGKLGLLAALRNIRNMMSVPRKNVIDALCKLLSNGELIRKAKIMPYQIDTAMEVIHDECINNSYSYQVLQALQEGYLKSIPNLAEALPGKTCVMVDCSGSMHAACYKGDKRMRSATACGKAGLLAATIAQATGADIVRFGSNASFYNYDPAMNVFKLGEYISTTNMGGTSISSAFNLIKNDRKRYDRIIILSDNECNNHGYWGRDWTSEAYASYVHDVASPYVYCIDLAAYGTTPLKNDGKINYYFGYGYAMFDDIASREFNPSMHIDKVRKVIIDPVYHETLNIA